jgi:asparagine synthase (glutamine-hydrolysing)
MCGLTGLVNLDGAPVDPALIARMTDALAHRGPDGRGIHCKGQVGLGHRRLAIIDLSAAAGQPMHSPDGRWTLVYNGEIYNFRTLRRELEQEGWCFRTRSDTEVLLAGAVCWGLDRLMPRIDGMAALALWDARECTLHLARDRHGTKPLYLWESGNHVAFASEIKAFLAHPAFQIAVNGEALREYFTFQNLFRDHTLFAGVTQLPASTILSIGPQRRHQRCYWDYRFLPEQDLKEPEAAEELRRLMSAAVERQLVADVPVGAYLSGGLDSGSLVALASQHLPRMQSFTAGFEMSRVIGPEITFDERRPAEMMACHFGTEHYEQVINAGDIRWSLPRVIWHLEDLRLGMCYPNYYIARLASKFVKVCLSGAGGDELFAGYPWRYYRVFRSLDRDDYLSSYFSFWQRLTNAEERRRLFRDPSDDKDTMFDVFTSVFDGQDNLRFASPEDHVSAALYFECRTFMRGLLTVGDRLSMAHGLEERFPFLDNALVDFAMALPVSHKLSDFGEMLVVDEDQVRKKLAMQNQFASGKSCLRQAMSPLLPDEVMRRPKQGFSAPDASWYRDENAAFVRERLLGSDLACAAWLDPDMIREKVEAHLEGRANNRLLIWSFLSFEEWCRIFLAGERPIG